jgi:ABC-type branched-subunit amino acid transport system ATPase component
MTLLQIDNVIVGYQEGIDILNNITMSVESNSVTIVIGPNGAGKSTLLKTIFGFLKPRSGTMNFDGRNIILDQPHQVKRGGISYIPQDFNVFPQLTVEQNLKMGAWVFRNDKERLKRQLEYNYEIFPALYKFRESPANRLSGGQLRMLSIAKEVMTSPKMILVDEPSSGLAPKIAAEAYDFLMETQRTLQVAIILVDHNMETALELANYVYVVNMGRVREHGPKSDFNIPRIKDIIHQCLLGE